MPVFESYLFEEHRAWRTARRHTLLNGYMTETEFIDSPQDTDQSWVLMRAVLSGSSGRLIRGQALLLRINAESIDICWRSPSVADLQAYWVESSGR